MVKTHMKFLQILNSQERTIWSRSSRDVWFSFIQKLFLIRNKIVQIERWFQFTGMKIASSWSLLFSKVVELANHTIHMYPISWKIFQIVQIVPIKFIMVVTHISFPCLYCYFLLLLVGIIRQKLKSWQKGDSEIRLWGLMVQGCLKMSISYENYIKCILP